MCVYDPQKEREGERIERKDTSAWDLGPGDFTFCQERERKTEKEKGIECERDMARLKYTECSISQKYSS